MCKKSQYLERDDLLYEKRFIFEKNWNKALQRSDFFTFTTDGEQRFYVLMKNAKACSTKNENCLTAVRKFICVNSDTVFRCHYFSGLGMGSSNFLGIISLLLIAAGGVAFLLFYIAEVRLLN